MCGRYTLATPDPRTLRARFALGEAVRVERRYNVAPGDDVLAVLMGQRGPEGARLRWGLVPPWAGDGARQGMINARAETVRAKPAFRSAFERRRCLIVADGFYEWCRPDGHGPRAARQAYWITRADGAPFAFAGLWASARTPTGATWRTCAIVTTAASRRLAPIHDRMPVILDPEAEHAWLRSDRPADALMTLLRPLPDERMALRPVGSAVNDARYDDPACLNPPRDAPPAAAAPRLF